MSSKNLISNKSNRDIHKEYILLEKYNTRYSLNRNLNILVLLTQKEFHKKYKENHKEYIHFPTNNTHLHNPDNL